MEEKSLIIKPFRSAGVTPAMIARTLWNHRDVINNWGSWALNHIKKLVGGQSNSNGAKSPPSSKGRMKRGHNVLYGAESSEFKEASVPIAKSIAMKNPVFTRFEQTPQNIGEHVPGIRIILRQLACAVNSTSNDIVLVAITGGVSIDGAGFYLSPDKINGRVALIARNFSKYAFRYVRFIYIPLCPTSTVGGFNACFSEDANVQATSTVTPLGILSTTPCFSTPFWQAADLEYSYTGRDTFHSEYSEVTGADKWITTQGNFLALANYTPLATANNGILMMEVILDLYQPSIDYGYTESMLERVRASDQTWSNFKQFEKRDVVIVKR